ncbi:msl8725 [Mesorhizobium japonicum MAFF 303099]|uniref:Msl8725 protein n=1 Tax=Mesorhizobium japonicum (strain LMG 29417 / CECT 9101 / MAFF 303099) TaxID=266835 RepID=Q984I2_RHILO|nr:msl8725 [Mesorhizobium japonicum MAFF 303099]
MGGACYSRPPPVSTGAVLGHLQGAVNGILATLQRVGDVSGVELARAPQDDGSKRLFVAEVGIAGVTVVKDAMAVWTTGLHLAVTCNFP